MTIVVTGGGSGGHITPLLAVAAELKKQEKDVNIVYIGQRGDRFARIVAESEYIDSTKLIFAGKFRRYHGEGWRQVLDIKTVLLNMRDLFFIAFGCMQSWRYLRKIHPSVVFIKGGFVGVPVGLAAGFWRIPYVTHDSDALAGLANRLIAKKAQVHAVALPKEIYAYPPEKTVTVGVPIAASYQLVDAVQQKAYKKDLGLPTEAKLVFVTGGGLGAKIINKAMTDIAPKLLAAYPTLYIIHSAGHAHSREVEDAYKNILPGHSISRVMVKDYLADMHVYSGAADVVVARAGATNMAELAAQGKACIVVPNPVLAGGHQLKNAQAFADAGAVTIVQQDDIKTDNVALYNGIAELLELPEKRQKLEKQLHTFAHSDAARKLAIILLEQAKK